MSVWTATSASTAAPAAKSVIKPATDTTAATGYAQMYLVTYLDAGKTNMDPLKAYYPDVDSLERAPHSMIAASTVPLAATDTGGGIWSVTVQTMVSDRTATGYSAPQPRCFTVTIVASSGAYRAGALPAEVSCPLTAAAALPQYTSTISDGPIADTVTAWAAAYLTGQGQLTRYITPGAPITPITPPPYSSLSVTSIQLAKDPAPPQDLQSVPSDGTRIVLTATVTATMASGITVPLSYPLTLTARGGRWEVTAVNPAPAIAASTEPAATPTPSSSAPPSPAAPTS